MEHNDKIWGKILKNEFDINQIDNLAKKHGFRALVVTDERGFSVIHWAVILGMNDLVAYLLKEGVPVDLKVKIKEEPQSIHLAALEGRLKIINILVNYGADVNAVDKKGCTPLMRAAMFGYNEETRTSDTMLHLISKGANPKLKDNIGFTILHYATFFGHEETVSFLLTIGLDPNERDNEGFKPLDIALHIRNRYIIDELAQFTHESRTGMLDDIIIKQSRLKLIDYLDLVFIIFARSFVFLFIITTLFWSYPQYIFHYYPASKELYPLHLSLFVSSCFVWICWYRSMRKDPGYLPIESDEYYDLLEYKLNLTDKNQIVRDDLFENANLCHICRTIQPKRTKHCRFCLRCVELFDHHCMYLNNCIGKGNRSSFRWLIFHMLFVGIAYMILILMLIQQNNWQFTYQHLINLAFCLKLIFISTVLTCCTFRRYRLIEKKEKLSKSNNYKYLKDRNHLTGGNQNFWSNLKGFLKINDFFIHNRLIKSDKYHYQKLNEVCTDSF